MAKKQTSTPASETITETLNIDGDEITVVRTVPAKKGRKAVRGRAAKEAPDTATVASTSPDALQGDQAAKTASAPDTGAEDAPRGKPRRSTSKKPAATTKAGAGATKGKRPAKTSPALPFGELAERFLQHLEAIGKSRATVFSYSIDLGVAARAFGAETDAGAITEAQVAEFFESDRVTKTRTGKAKSNLTIDKTRRVARQVFAWAATEGLISTSPVPADAVPTGKRKAKDAGSEEAAAA